MTSNLTRQLSTGFSNKAALQGEATLYMSWSVPFVSAGRTNGRNSEVIVVLLLESAEPLSMDSRLLAKAGDAVRKAFGREPIERLTVRERIENAAQGANELVLREMASALAAQTQRISLMQAVFMPTGENSCDVMIGGVGACRAFLRHHQHILPLTTPHTWGQENVESRIISEADEENEHKYPYWRRPTRFLGSMRTVAMDFTLDVSQVDALVDAGADCVKLHRGDSIILCSSRLTATSLEKQADRIDARSAAALAQQLTERAVLPGGNGAAAVVIGWSNGLGLIPVGATVLILALGALAFLIFGFPYFFPPPPATPPAINQTTATDPFTSTVTVPEATVTPAPTEGAPANPTGTSTSTPPPIISTETPTGLVLQPPRAPTATTVPTNTPLPTATSTSTPPPTVTSTATMISTSATVPFDRSMYAVALMEPLPDHTVGESNRTVQFDWLPSTELPDGYEYELVFWLEGTDPLIEGRSPVGAGRGTSTSVTFPVIVGSSLITYQDICWGVRAWRVDSKSAVDMLSNGCRVLNVRTESGRPSNPGPSATPDTSGGNPIVPPTPTS